MGSDEIRKNLSTFTSAELCWFSFRCALRALPVLAIKGPQFPLWKDNVREYLFSVLRACNASIAISVHFVSASADAYADAAAYDADAYAYLAADAYAYAASNAAYAAYAAAYVAAKADAKADAAYAAYAASVVAYAAANVDARAADADISFLSNKHREAGWPELWHGTPPDAWLNLEKMFLSGLQFVKLDYWADEYRDWVQGRFSRDRIERCLLMPSTTIAAGPDAMLIYLGAELVRMAEARVIFLGEGGAGKTSLIRRLHREDIRGDEPATPRVEIRRRQETIYSDEVMVHYWDFGGQVIMHATHQFFLREKSVYVIVLDIRRCDSLEYWLDHVRVFAPGAPTLIVLNKVDSLVSGMETTPPFDIEEICQRYPFVVKKIYLLSCKTFVGEAGFSKALRAELAKNYTLSPDMPVEWFEVKETLAKENSDFITMKRFDTICTEKGIDPEGIEPALRVLDNLGLAIHFPDLRETQVVLNPEWITKAIYYIIWASEKEKLDGQLSVWQIKKLFAKGRGAKELEVDVPDDKCGFLLGLMTQFKLAFKVQNGRGTYCVPMLTPVNEPDHGVSREGGLQFVFSFQFLPPGLFYRFIAESGYELVDTWIWKTGAVFAADNTTVLVKYIEYQRTVTMYAHGDNPGLYLTTLRLRFMKLLGESYKELDYVPYAVTPKGERINWKEILVRYGKEGDAANAYADAGESVYPIHDILARNLGTDGVKLTRKLEKEGIYLMINIQANNTLTANPVATATNSSVVSLSLTITACRTVVPVESDLKRIKELLDDFKEDHPEQASEHEQELRRLEREIDRLRTDIIDLEAVTDDCPVAEEKRKTILGRFKERWDSVAEMSKQCYYVAGFAAIIGKIGNSLAKIDWPVLIRTFC